MTRAGYYAVFTPQGQARGFVYVDDLEAEIKRYPDHRFEWAVWNERLAGHRTALAKANGD
jgi:hypothetical protein